MENDEKELHNRLTEPHRSKAAKIGWKRHRSSYNRANRKKERDCMNDINDSFYSISKNLEKVLNNLDEAKIVKDNVFELDYQIDFENLSGGLTFTIDKDNNNISFSVALSESGKGVYRPVTEETSEEDLQTMYGNIKQDIQDIALHLDSEIKQLLNKYGLKEV